jgi:hypothetical protein
VNSDFDIIAVGSQVKKKNLDTGRRTEFNFSNRNARTNQFWNKITPKIGCSVWSRPLVKIILYSVIALYGKYGISS